MNAASRLATSCSSARQPSHLRRGKLIFHCKLKHPYHLHSFFYLRECCCQLCTITALRPLVAVCLAAGGRQLPKPAVTTFPISSLQNGGELETRTGSHWTDCWWAFFSRYHVTGSVNRFGIFGWMFFRRAEDVAVYFQRTNPGFIHQTRFVSERLCICKQCPVCSSVIWFGELKGSTIYTHINMHEGVTVNTPHSRVPEDNEGSRFMQVVKRETESVSGDGARWLAGPPLKETTQKGRRTFEMLKPLVS